MNLLPTCIVFRLDLYSNSSSNKLIMRLQLLKKQVKPHLCNFPMYSVFCSQAAYALNIYLLVYKTSAWLI